METTGAGTGVLPDSGVIVPDAATAVRRICGTLVPDHLRDCGMAEEHLPFIVANCRGNSMKNNPEPMSGEQAETLLRCLV